MEHRPSDGAIKRPHPPVQFGVLDPLEKPLKETDRQPDFRRRAKQQQWNDGRGIGHEFLDEMKPVEGHKCELLLAVMHAVEGPEESSMLEPMNPVSKKVGDEEIDRQRPIDWQLVQQMQVDDC